MHRLGGPGVDNPYNHIKYKYTYGSIEIHFFKYEGLISLYQNSHMNFKRRQALKYKGINLHVY
jgi:hypothetical protein